MNAASVIGVGQVTKEGPNRRLDRYARFAVAAAEAAVADAGLDPATWARDRVAVVLGTALGCYESNLEHHTTPGPRAFAATLPSTPVGEIAIRLRAGGPQLALAQGADAYLAALAEARRLLAAGRADLVLAGTAEAVPEGIRAAYPEAPPDGATFYVLARARAHARGAIHGGGQAFGADALERAIAAAWREAGPARPGMLVWTAEDALGGASALVVS